MASDDMHVVMYKILKYLYECLKKGVEPNMEMFDADALGVNERYWTVIMQELMERGYVAGFVTKQLGKDVNYPEEPERHHGGRGVHSGQLHDEEGHGLHPRSPRFHPVAVVSISFGPVWPVAATCRQRYETRR